MYLCTICYFYRICTNLTLKTIANSQKFISEKGYDSQFGARPLHRAIQKYLEDPLAEEILNMNVKMKDKIRIYKKMLKRQQKEEIF